MNTYSHEDIRYWYDRSIMSWTVQRVDSQGYQVGDCEYYANKDSLLANYPFLKFKQQ